MNFISLRASVNKAISYIFVNTENDTDIKNKIITGCLVFYALQKLINRDSTLLTQISNKAIELTKTYKGIVENLSKKYISYKEIYTYLRDNNVNEFINITMAQINHVIELYENKQEIRKFSTKEYSQYMYNIMFISNSDNLYLKNIHYTVLVPLVEHYIRYNNINEKDISVENVYNISPGKVIKFAIRGISCGKIYYDINHDIVGNKKYIYKTELTPDGFLQITMN